MSGTLAPARPLSESSPTPPPASALRGALWHGPGRWAGGALAVTQLLTLGAEAASWQGMWSETQALLHSFTVLIAGPLALAAGCWSGGLDRRRGTRELLSTGARSPLRRLLMAALPVAAWVVAAHLLSTALVLLASWPYTSGGRPVVVQQVGDTAYLIAAVLVGEVAGRVLPWRLTGPVLGVAAYAGLGLPGGSRFGVPRLSPYWGVDTYAYGGIVAWQPPAMAAWLLALAGAVVLVHAARRRWSALVALAVAVLAALPLLQADSLETAGGAAAGKEACDTSIRPHVCVDARHSGLLPELTRALRPLADRLEGVGNLPARWSELHPRRAGSAPLPQLMYGQEVVRDELTAPARWRFDAARSLSLPDPCDARVEDRRTARVDDTVQDWLAPLENTADTVSERQAREQGDERVLAQYAADRASMRRLRSMGTEERRAWLTRYFAQRRGCDPEEVPHL